MKKLSLFILLLGLFSCDLDGNENTNLDNITASELTDDLTISSGLRVVQFIEDGQDETSDYSGFIFQFSDNGTVRASQGNIEISGTYRVFRDDGKTELAMIFPSDSILNEFTDDWYFSNKSNNQLTFEDNDEDGLSRLVFEY